MKFFLISFFICVNFLYARPAPQNITEFPETLSEWEIFNPEMKLNLWRDVARG